MKPKILLTIIIYLSLAYNLKAQPKIAYTPVITGLSNAVDAVFGPGDGRMFIAQQNGLIRIRNGASLSTFINLSSVLTSPAGGEQGLLSIAFHPGYASNRYFFVLYTGAGGNINLARYRRNATDANIADLSSGQVLLSIAKPGAPYYTNHNGGKINFGSDGYLYISIGDGGSGGDPHQLSQNLASLLGKMLRIDVNGFATSAPFYDIPSTNPFAAAGDGFSDEIFSFGLRNPWRWSFDSQTGDIWIADVGQGNWEEINRNSPAEANGGNYGWRCYEGAHIYNLSGCAAPDTLSPVSEYGHNGTTGGYSITGGYVYRGTLFPTLQGYYIATDYITGHIWLVRQNGSNWQTFFQSLSDGGISAGVAGFAEAPTGALYAVVRGSGRIDSISVVATVPVRLQQFEGTAQNEFNSLQWLSNNEEELRHYQLEVSSNAINFNTLASIEAKGAGFPYRYQHHPSSSGYLFYRLAMVLHNGTRQYSNIIKIFSGNVQGATVIYPTVITSARHLNVKAPVAFELLQLINSSGKVVFEYKAANPVLQQQIKLPAQLAAGLYIVRLKLGNDWVHNKLLIQ